jgi:5'-deoxynucleotidase YfbR-like HD superfamily hydrolase
MMQKPDLNRIMELQKLLLIFSQIERVVDRRHKDSYTRESDTEHSYNLAMTAWFLAPYFPHLDKDTLIKFALIHDIVEVHAGDTFAYSDAATLATKAAREEAALQQLEKEWPDFPDLTATIHEYEKRTSEEAKFIYALDKIMPMMVIYMSDGRTWKNEGVTVDLQHNSKKDKIAVSKDIKPYYDALHELLVASPHLFAQAK